MVINASDQPPAGTTDPASPATPDPGNQGEQPGAKPSTQPESGQPSSVPDDPTKGTPPDPRDETIKQQKQDIKNLNRAVIDAKRDGRKTPISSDQQENPFDSEAGQYAATLELSDARLRGGLEERIALYPELPPEEMQRIRLNPWAFASRKSFLEGDYEMALQEVEQAMLDRVEEIVEEKAKSTKTPQGQDQPEGAPAPAQVDANAAPETHDEAIPGSEEDVNPWTMPLDKLEQLAKKETVKLSQQPK